MNNSCIFCKIIAKEVPCTPVYETDDILVIKDLYPKAPIHYLIIPKKHAKDIQDLAHDDMHLGASMIKVAKELSAQLPGTGDFKLVVNSGEGSGQSIFHLHMHFVAGKQLGEI
ncbi:MAG: HIT domain-containing protein [Candidatus Babeliales bacterium]